MGLILGCMNHVHGVEVGCQNDIDLDPRMYGRCEWEVWGWI